MFKPHSLVGGGKGSCLLESAFDFFGIRPEAEVDKGGKGCFYGP